MNLSATFPMLYQHLAGSFFFYDKPMEISTIK